jgi:hypothetical protein
MGCVRASSNSSKRKEIQCQPDCAERKRSIENEMVIKEMQMNEEKDTGLVPKDGTSDYSSW